MTSKVLVMLLQYNHTLHLSESLSITILIYVKLKGKMYAL